MLGFIFHSFSRQVNQAKATNLELMAMNQLVSQQAKHEAASHQNDRLREGEFKRQQARSETMTRDEMKISKDGLTASRLKNAYSVR